MGDMGELFRDLKEHDKIRKARNLADAQAVALPGWTIHSLVHWSRDLNGFKLDYWPSRNKFRWKNKTYTGDVNGFIKNREPTT